MSWLLHIPPAAPGFQGMTVEWPLNKRTKIDAAWKAPGKGATEDVTEDFHLASFQKVPEFKQKPRGNHEERKPDIDRLESPPIHFITTGTMPGIHPDSKYQHAHQVRPLANDTGNPSGRSLFWKAVC